jgi:hypothetical protein
MQHNDRTGKPSRQKNVLVAVTIATLLAFNLVQLYINQRNNQSKDAIIIDKGKEIISMNSKLEEISADLDRQIALVRLMGGRADSLLQLQSKLEEEKFALRLSSETAEETYKEYYEEIKSRLKEYEERLEGQRQEILRLHEERRDLLASQGVLSKKQEELDSLVAMLQDEKGRLEDRMRYAGQPVAKGIQFYADHPTQGKVPIADARAAKTSKLVVSVGLIPNGLAKAGNKVLYLVLYDPEGKMLAQGPDASIKVGGQDIFFAQSQSFEYNPGPDGQEVEVRYAQQQAFKQGIYRVMVYCSDASSGPVQLLGSANFTLK